MKIRFTEVTVENIGGVLTGLSASYVATDSDGAGNIGVDSGGLAAPETGAPTYASLAAVQALTQTQIYNDFYDTTVVVVDSFNSFIIGEEWKSDLQEALDIQVAATQFEAGLVPIDTVDNITDQTPIDI